MTAPDDLLAWLERLEALEKVASPRNWKVSDGALYSEVPPTRGMREVQASVENLALIAAIRNAAPRLLALARAGAEFRKACETFLGGEPGWKRPMVEAMDAWDAAAAGTEAKEER